MITCHWPSKTNICVQNHRFWALQWSPLKPQIRSWRNRACSPTKDIFLCSKFTMTGMNFRKIFAGAFSSSRENQKLSGSSIGFQKTSLIEFIYRMTSKRGQSMPSLIFYKIWAKKLWSESWRRRTKWKTNLSQNTFGTSGGKKIWGSSCI